MLIKSLCMFRMSQHPSSGVLKTVTADSGTVHNTGTATSLQSGLIRPRWWKDHIISILRHTLVYVWKFINIYFKIKFNLKKIKSQLS